MMSRIEAAYEGQRIRAEVMALIAMLPKIAGFTSDMSKIMSAWSKIRTLNAVNFTTSVITGFINDAREVGVTITCNHPATLMSAISERVEGFRSGQCSIIPPLYKGVSYNPAGANWREWLVLLDFFAIMRKFADRFSAGVAPQIAVLDASLYWVVNLLGEGGICISAKNPLEAACELIDQLCRHVKEQSPQPEVYQIALQRNAHMRAVAEQFPARCAPPVFTVLDIWQDPGFAEFLAIAIKNFCTYQGGRWRVTRAVSYQRYMTYSPWVTPLVVAEQTYMTKRCDFRLFLAPVQEAAWNNAVDLMSRLTHTSRYAVLMYDRPQTGELAYSDFPFFSDSWPEMTTKFARAPQLLPIVAGFVKPFLGDQAADLEDMVAGSFNSAAARTITEFTARIDTRARELASGGFQPLSLDNLGWLMQFPPGTC